MPYLNEFARGESLWRLVESPSVQEFKGVINYGDSTSDCREPPYQIDPRRGSALVQRIVAVDGSTVTAQVRNGFPGAEAALLQLAVIVVNVRALRRLPDNPIPRPATMRSLEHATTLDAVLPGRNVIRKEIANDSPMRFFRAQVYQLLSRGRIDAGHETLLDTMRAITSNRMGGTIRCPVEDCDRSLEVQGASICRCDREEPIFATDSLRCHERFEERGSSAEAFTAVQQIVEHLALVNMLRYFERMRRWNVFRSTAFIMDGPLAIFGMPAWLKAHIQHEVKRLHELALEHVGSGILLFGVEKSGQFLDHLKALDWSHQNGPGQELPNSTAFAPNQNYVHKYIVLRPLGAKPYGQATYYGRKIMYKNRAGQHTVIVTPIVNKEGEDPTCIDENAYPRIGDVLDLMDELSTYLYENGFAPLVRAHAHAAIPLKRGTRLLESLFVDE